METLVYRFYDEMGLEEIAGLMRVNRKTVQNRLARAAATLSGLTGRSCEHERARTRAAVVAAARPLCAG